MYSSTFIFAKKQYDDEFHAFEAKKSQSKWLDGYRVEISEIIKTYGDSRLPII